MKPDLLTTQIKHCDYPIWRDFLENYRDRFGKLIFYFNENNRFPYLDHFMHSALEPLGNTVFLDQVQMDWGTQDWRNVATNEMLKYSDSEWVASIEGDFFTTNWEKLLDAVENASKTYDILGFKGHQGQQEHQTAYLTGEYVHPAFWFMKRELLEKTSKDFSANTSRGCDHFGLITQDIQNMQIPIWFTQDNGFSEEETFHQGGFNQNYFEVNKDQMILNRPELFYIYNYYAMRTDVVQSPLFLDIMTRMDGKLYSLYPNIDPKTDSRKVFYES